MICQIAPPPRPCLGRLIRDLLEAEPESVEWRVAFGKLINAGVPLGQIRRMLDWYENVVLKSKGAEE